jgi:DNA-binding transcriptional regulator YiaG
LKDEVRRLARKEIKTATARTSRAVPQYRREIARLKRLVRDQDRKLSLLEKQVQRATTAPAAANDTDSSARFSARSVKAQRRRTGLSAADYSRLVGVSPLTIYHWESGKTRPRKGQFAALVGLRGLGKREARAKLEQIGASARKPTRTRRRKR